MAVEVITAPPSGTSTTTTTTGTRTEAGVPGIGAVMTILGVVAVICALGLVVIGSFSIYLQTLEPAREAGSSVGAVRENLMNVLTTIVGAFAIKAKVSP